MTSDRDPPPERPAVRPLDAVVRERFSLSWGEARGRITSGKVKVADVVRLDPLFRVRDPALVTLDLNAPRPRAPLLPDGAIVHVDAHVVVVDKPSGISTIPFDEDETGTLDERVRTFLSRHGGKARGGGRPPLGVVHRIDKETSGLVVFTRTWQAKESLTQQFRSHTVLRRYDAIVMGKIETQTIRTMIMQNRGDGLRGSKKGKGGGEGQRAVTHITAVEALEGATRLSCKLETGRTHQIRIHLSEAGHPLVGERVYVRGYRGDPIPAARMMLHATELGFVHPATEQEVVWQRDPPGDFMQTLERLRRRRKSDTP